jgi:hypothetical protein
MANFSSTNYADFLSQPTVKISNELSDARVKAEVDSTPADTFSDLDLIIFKRANSGMRILDVNGIPSAGAGNGWDIVYLDDDGTENDLELLASDGKKDALEVPEGKRLAFRADGAVGAIAASNVQILYTSGNS